MEVGEDDGAASLHAWFNLSHVGRSSLLPQDIPFNLERNILSLCGVQCIINTQKLENNWLQTTCHTGRFDISVQHASHWDALQEAIPFAIKIFPNLISEVTGQGAVSSHAASLGEMAYAETLGPYLPDLSTGCLNNMISNGKVQKPGKWDTGAPSPLALSMLPPRFLQRNSSLVRR
jgi:hypothetical protein